MRFSLVGAGEIGALRAEALAKIEGCSLVGVADTESARRERLGVPGFPGMADLLSGPPCDAVIVSTPPDRHEEAVAAALDAGKHVLCEKPLAPTPEAVRGLVETARAREFTLAVGFNQRHFPAVAFAKEAIADGRIGALRHVRAWTGHRGLSEFRRRWEYDPAVTGGGALSDNGIHLIDLVRYLSGDYSQVAGATSEAVWRQPGAEDNGFALLTAADGRIASLHASWTEWRGYRFEIEVFGDRGMIRLAYGPMRALLVESDESGKTVRNTRRLYPEVALREKLRGWQSTVRATFERELRDFQERVRGGAVASAEGFDGFRAAEIAKAARRAAAERSTVELSDPF